MAQHKAHPEDLVLTQADPAPPPHDITVSEPELDDTASNGSSDLDREVLTELKRLARRIGIERLKVMVEKLGSVPR